MHTYATANTYNVTVTVTDNENDIDSASQDVIVGGTGGGGTMHVGDLDATVRVKRRNWTAKATIFVYDDNEILVANALVSGNWDTVGATCTTNGKGKCSIGTGSLDLATTSAKFTVDNVSLAGVTYNSVANHDLEGDSNGTTIIVSQP